VEPVPKRLAVLAVLAAALATPALADRGNGICIWGIPGHEAKIPYSYRRCWTFAERDGGRSGCTPWEKTSLSTPGVQDGRATVSSRRMYMDWTEDELRKEPAVTRRRTWFEVEIDESFAAGYQSRILRMDTDFAEEGGAPCARREDTYRFVRTEDGIAVAKGCPAGFANCLR
jgi:hypothetical protein